MRLQLNSEEQRVEMYNSDRVQEFGTLALFHFETLTLSWFFLFSRITSHGSRVTRHVPYTNGSDQFSSVSFTLCRNW